MDDTTTPTEVYQPRPAWQPDEIDHALEQMAADMTSGQLITESQWLDECQFAKRLANASHDYLQGSDKKISGVSRAHRALREGGGNCIAHTEIGLGVAGKLGLDMMAVFSKEYPYDWHASSLWVGRAAIWEIDFYFQERSVFGQYSGSTSEIQAFTRTTSQANQGAHTMFNHADSTFEGQHITSSPGETPNPFVDHENSRITTILPPREGMDMLGAVADYLGFKAAKPERFARLAGQIMSFIPPGIV